MQSLLVGAVLTVCGCLDLNDANYRFPAGVGGGQGGGGSRVDGGTGGGTGGGLGGGTGGGGGSLDGGDPELPIGGCLIITPNPVDLGTVKRNCSSQSRTFSIYNTCGQERPVTLTAVTLTARAGEPAGGPNCPGTVDCAEYFITETPTIPPGGLVLGSAGAAVAFQVKYVPLNLGTDEGRVTVQTSEGTRSLSYPVHIRATGDSSGDQVDTFVQAAQAQADVLMVVDDSGSMADKQDNLADNFGAFLKYATGVNVDYHLAVTSTTNETSDGGQLCIPNFGCFPEPSNSSLAPAGLMFRDLDAGISHVLTPRSFKPAATFSTMVHLGTNGSGSEQGLATATAALTEPLISGPNKGFLRRDANLAIVVVSDAHDDSPQPLSYYQNLLINVKGVNNRSKFTFNNIGRYLATAPQDCSYDDTGVAGRYDALVRDSSGVAAEICSRDWAAPLTRLGDIAFGFRTQFFLNAVPDLTAGKTVKVHRNGGLQALTMSCPPEASAVVCFDAASSSIQFRAASAPVGGDTITVSYSTSCL